MSENQVEQEQTQAQAQAQAQAQTQTTAFIQVSNPIKPVVYSSLLEKLRANNVTNSDNFTKQTKTTESSNPDKDSRGFKNNQNTRPKIRQGFRQGFRPRSTFKKEQPEQTKQPEQTEQTERTEQTEQPEQTEQTEQTKQTNKNYQTRLPMLSAKEYSNELVKCQNKFFVHLSEYLNEQVVTRPKLDNSKDKKSQELVKSVKRTNLERIQGGVSVNVMKVVKEKEQDEDLRYLSNLVSNRGMNFVDKLSEWMGKANVVTTFRNRDTIWIHSPYLKM